MAKKQYFLILDSETTIENTVADIGIVIADKQGNIVKEMGVLIKGEFDAKSLFFDVHSKDEIWTKAGLEKRQANYVNMLNNGQRMIASVNAVNRWLDQAFYQYQPVLTAFNLAFDLDKCQNTGIDLTKFIDRFCLWNASYGHFANTKEFKRFVLNNHLFNAPTKHGNMTYKTNAEVMASFLNNEMLPPEPHTALEDAKFYELPILKAIVKKSKWRDKIKPYNWRDCQVKDNFTV
jgi:hypothetical protein